jgi:hypothetical protein
LPQSGYTAEEGDYLNLMKNIAGIFLMQRSQMTQRKNKKNSALRLFLFLFVSINTEVIFAQTIGQNYSLLIGGLGGEQHYSEKIYYYLENTRSALIDKFQFPEKNIILLAETKYKENQIVDGISNEETIREKFIELSKLVNENDNVFIILYGHGSYDGKNAKLNIPRRDLTNFDYGELVDRLKVRQIIFINTASSSSLFINSLSEANRIIITATSSPTQRNFTVFPKYFVEGLTSDEVDFDRNSNISVLELFRFATEKTNRFFSDGDHLATEFAMLEDTGDKKAFRVDELEENNEGNLAAVINLKRGVDLLASGEITSNDSSLVRLVKEKEKIELDIAKLKGQKNQLSEQDYFTKLEEFLVKLASVNDQIENKNKK